MRIAFLALIPWVMLAVAAASAGAAVEAAEVRPWPEYRTIMWIGDSAYKDPAKTPLFFARLREMGINTAMVYGDGNLQPLIEAKFPYYVENMVNRGLCLKFNSNVRDWDKFVTDWAAQGRPDAALIRDYCLDDPQWRNRASNEVLQIARKNAPHEPIAYDIRDELSVTFSANPFDYDFDPIALEGFRTWLKQQYGGLEKLNEEWETSFAKWEDVMPFTTDRIKNRMASGAALPKGKPDWGELQGVRFNLKEARKTPTRWNFSPWADFRTYMDISLAGALADLRTAARSADPRAPVGIEGTQMPHAFGGYDLWRLSRSVDWVEPYDIGNAREIFGSFMPGKPMLTTVFEKETEQARRRLWHLLLEGDRGCFIWWSEDCFDWKSNDVGLTPKAKALKPVLEEMTSPLARLFMTAKKAPDPVLIHYSQPSIQAEWLIESTVDGSTWLRRFSSFEADHNHQVKVRNSWLKAFQDLGFSPRFVSSEQIEAGELNDAKTSVLILPESWALSDKEAARIRSFQDGRAGNAPGIVFADGTPGVFDEHCRLRAQPALGGTDYMLQSDQRRVAVLRGNNAPKILSGDVADYAKQRLSGTGQLPEWIRSHLGGIKTDVTVPLPAKVRVHRYLSAGTRLLAFERNISYQMSEDLKQGGGNEALEKPVELDATLSRPGHIYDLRTGAYMGELSRIHFTLNPWQPALFAITTVALKPGNIVEQLLQDSIK